MPEIDIQTLVLARLEDFANHCADLMDQGKHEEAVFIREEGYRLAEAYDGGSTFIYLPDFNAVN